MSSAADKAQVFAKNLSKNFNLDDSGIFLPVFSSRTNLQVHSISVTSEMVKKVITNLNSSKVFSPDCIPVVVLKNCEPELSYRPAELFSISHKESIVSDYWTVSLNVGERSNVSIKNVGERSTAKNYHPVSFLSVFIKIFEKLVNNRIDC